MLKRSAIATATVVALIALTGCSGQTAPATDVTETSAVLHADVSWRDGEVLNWWFETRVKGSGGSFALVKRYGPAALRGNVSGVPITEKLTGLTPGTTYQYRLCGYFTASNGKPVGSPESPICVDKDAAAPNDNYSEFTTAGTQPDLPPQTSITSEMRGTIYVDSIAFEFESSDPGSSFECSLNGSQWEACSTGKTYSGLQNAFYTFRVRAIDPAGNADPTPAQRAFWVSVLK